MKKITNNKNNKIKKNNKTIIFILLICVIFTIQFAISQAKYYIIFDAGTINLNIIGKNAIIHFDINSGYLEDMSGIENYTVQNNITTKIISEGKEFGRLPKVTPSSNEYEFIGWYTDLNGGTRVTKDTIVKTNGEITLYAKWRISKIKVEIPDTMPTVSQTSPLVASWVLNSASLKTSSNPQTYESLLLTKTKSDIDVINIPTGSSAIKNWYSAIGAGSYYIPTFSDDCKKIRITMDEGYITTSTRKNPKIIFVQGNSIDKLIPNGVADEKGGQTDIPNTFGERQIAENLTEVYQIKNGEIIDFSPYWNEEYTYHAIVMRGYDKTSVTNIKGATIEYIYDDKIEDQDQNQDQDKDKEQESDILIQSSVKVEMPDSMPETSQTSPLVPSWVLGSPSLRVGCNNQKYESMLLTKTKTAIDVTQVPHSTTEVKTWYNEIGTGSYYIPTIPDGCQKIRITMDEGYNSVNTRKNPKVIFVQGNSTDKLIPNGIADEKGGQTDIPNTFGERQIVESPTEIYQIKNGDIIDLSPYWDSSYKYHAIVIRGYDTSLSKIKGATIDYIKYENENNNNTENPEDTKTSNYSYMGTVTNTTSNSFQGSLVDEKSKILYQFIDGGHCMLLNIETLETIREINLPTTRGAGHFSSVEWLDSDNKIFMTTCCKGSQTTYASDIYIYDISNESDIKITTVTCPELNSNNYSYMADLAYDKNKKLLYVGGYTPSGTTRNNLYISTIDMSPYVNNKETTVHIVGEPFTEKMYHLQDGAFYNGKIYYLIDSTISSSSYNCFSVIEIDPSTQKITRVLSVELDSYKEAEGISIVSGSNPYIIMSYIYGGKEYYYKYILN